MVGDDGQGLDSRARGLAHDGALDLHESGQIGSRAHGPAVADPDQVDAAVGVTRDQFGEQLLGIGTLGQMTLDLVQAEGFGGGEEKRLDEAEQLKSVAHDCSVL